MFTDNELAPLRAEYQRALQERRERNKREVERIVRDIEQDLRTHKDKLLELLKTQHIVRRWDLNDILTRTQYPLQRNEDGGYDREWRDMWDSVSTQLSGRLGIYIRVIPEYNYDWDKHGHTGPLDITIRL